MRPSNASGDSFFAWEGEMRVVNILGKPSAGKDVIGKPKGRQLKVGMKAAPPELKPGSPLRPAP